MLSILQKSINQSIFQDGTTSLAIVTPVNGAAAERAVTLGQLIGRIKNGASALQGFKVKAQVDFWRKLFNVA